jgi:alginate O-acetyltransferase complex protein AlgI
MAIGVPTLLIVGLLQVLLGFWAIRSTYKRAWVLISWINLFGSVAAIYYWAEVSSPFMLMLFYIVISLTILKVLVCLKTYSGSTPLNFAQWLCFCLGWVGMRPTLFERLRFANPVFEANELLIKALTRMLAGFIFLLVATFALPTELYYVRFYVLLIGLSLFLHFGILNLQAWWWNCWGATCSELFKSPLKSKSLHEFWGKRWNLAFSEMTAVLIYRPLKQSYSTSVALFIAFLFSGMLHEMAISFPVKYGIGMPMLYFFLHGILMLMEQQIPMLQKLLQNRWISRIWVIFWLIAPLPLLFHQEFVKMFMIQ